MAVRSYLWPSKKTCSLSRSAAACSTCSALARLPLRLVSPLSVTPRTPVRHRSLQDVLLWARVKRHVHIEDGVVGNDRRSVENQAQVGCGSRPGGLTSLVVYSVPPSVVDQGVPVWTKGPISLALFFPLLGLPNSPSTRGAPGFHHGVSKWGAPGRVQCLVMSSKKG